jgi:hypothetical protein
LILFDCVAIEAAAMSARAASLYPNSRSELVIGFIRLPQTVSLSPRKNVGTYLFDAAHVVDGTTRAGMNYDTCVALGGAVPVSDRSEELRRAAAECLRRARSTRDDPGARAALLILARKSFDLADNLAEKDRNNNTVAPSLNGQTPHVASADTITRSDEGR